LFKLHEIWLVVFFWKIVKIVATRCQILWLNAMHQIRFRLGLRPRPRWGSLQRSPRPPSWIWITAGFKGAYFSAKLFTVDSRHVVPAC